MCGISLFIPSFWHNVCPFFFLSALHDLWDLSSSVKDWTYVLGVKAWSPNHWTTREFPQCLSLKLKWISYRQHIVGSWFFLFHSVTVCLLVGDFNPFTFKEIIDRCGLSMAILYNFWPFCSSFVPFFPIFLCEFMIFYGGIFVPFSLSCVHIV